MATDDLYDEFKDDVGPGPNLLPLLNQLADELLEAQKELEEAEEVVTKAKEKVKNISEKRIPAATEGMFGEFDLGDARSLILKKQVHASIAGEKKDPAIGWMDKNGHDKLVKRQLIIELPKDSLNDFKLVSEAVNKMTGLKAKPVLKSNFSVHHATLKSWVKEQLGEGVDLPREIFGIYDYVEAKVKV